MGRRPEGSIWTNRELGSLSKYDGNVSDDARKQ